VAEVDDSTNQISGVAERYAQALFSLAQEQNATDAVADALSNFGGLIAQSADLQRFVASPVFSAGSKNDPASTLIEMEMVGSLWSSSTSRRRPLENVYSFGRGNRTFKTVFATGARFLNSTLAAGAAAVSPWEKAGKAIRARASAHKLVLLADFIVRYPLWRRLARHKQQCGSRWSGISGRRVERPPPLRRKGA